MACEQFSLGVVSRAARYGIEYGELPLIINGCSGGMSWAYRLALGRKPSCEDCCNMHDLLYAIGSAAGTRKAADQELLWCAMRMGKAVPGWLERLRAGFPKIAFCFGWVPPLRQRWRRLRAWAMYAAVRLFGKSHWAG